MQGQQQDQVRLGPTYQPSFVAQKLKKLRPGNQIHPSTFEDTDDAAAKEQRGRARDQH
jgi:hypothetical protein